jgi:hypothetical protein
MLDAELPGFADERDIFTGAIGLNLLQQRFKTLFDCGMAG